MCGFFISNIRYSDEVKPKVIAIVGATASGKSALAVSIAHQINGEVISADSRQIYTGLNIGTGKITKKEMEGISHYMIDVWSPETQRTVTEYCEKAKSYLDAILKNKKVPIVCGGTGLYIESLLFDITYPEVPIDQKLRKSLEQKSTTELSELLLSLDPKRHKTIDTKNPVRLIRAIEIASALGHVPSVTKNNPYDILWIGIGIEHTELRTRISQRLKSRIDAGMFEEGKTLHAEGLSYKRMDELGLEYRYMAYFLNGDMSYKEAVQKLETEIIQYAKRQMTWFRKNKDIVWFSHPTDALLYVQHWLAQP